MKQTKKSAKVAKILKGSDIELKSFMTLLCASQKMITPLKTKMHSGTIAVFDAYKMSEGKVQGVNLCKKQDRDVIFDSFPKVCSYNGMTFSRERKKEDTDNGAMRRVLQFSTEVIFPKVKS